MSKTTEKIEIEIDGNFEEYQIIKVYEYTSDRKMRSVLVKNLADNKLFLFTKGADDILVPLASNSQKKAEI